MLTDERLAHIEAGHQGCDQPLAPCHVPELIAEVRRLRGWDRTAYTCAGCGAQSDGRDRQRRPKAGQASFCLSCRVGNLASKRLSARRARMPVGV